MRRHLYSLLLMTGLLFSSGFAFLDVPERSSLYLPLQQLTEQGIIESGSFFRAESPVPMQMFLTGIFRATLTAFPTEGALPPNVDPTGELAPVLRAAVDRGLVRADTRFEGLASISKLEAIKAIITVRKIAPARRISPAFARKYLSYIPENLHRSIEARYIEAAIASGIVNAQDLKTIDADLSRQDFVHWLTNMTTTAENKNRLETDNRKIVIEINKPKSDKPSPKKSAEKLTTFPNQDIFQRVFDDVLEQYRFSEELTTEKKAELIEGAIEGMVKKLDDKHSGYVVPENSKNYLERLNGNFEGIGAYVNMVDDHFTITSPISGAPAEQAGLKGGDVVTMVDGELIKGLTQNEIVYKIKGPAGTEVKLTVLRKGRTHEFGVIRQKIIVPSIEFELQKGIPIIRIKSFDESMIQKFKTLIQEKIVGKNYRGLILDLRNNPGGFLHGAVALTGVFAEVGDLAFSVEFNGRREEYRATERGPLADQPNVVILQNEGSASASEIFSAFMQETGKATIVGTVSYGKGTVQRILKYVNGGMLKLTIAKWLTPNENWIHEKGVQPNVLMESRTPEQIKQKIDPLLDRAVRLVLGQ